ncbi:MAG: sulfite exporter TauE/SafE family protein [bacterium]
MMVWLCYCLLGGVAGVLAGLLGVGGGLIIVPVLVILFAKQSFLTSQIQHLAVGTSLASIVFTSLSSMRAHHQRAGVDWGMVWRLSPAIVVGALSGAWVASQISTRCLQWVFVVFIYGVAAQMFLNAAVPHSQAKARHGVLLSLISVLIGGVSSLVGVGGGSLLVPLLSWCNLPMRRAIGTSAAIGFFIASSGAAGSMMAGWGTGGLPKYSIGYVYLPAVAGIALLSTLTAPLGARLAHRVPVPMLKRFFAVLLCVIGLKMIMGLL